MLEDLNVCTQRWYPGVSENYIYIYTTSSFNIIKTCTLIVFFIKVFMFLGTKPVSTKIESVISKPKNKP